MRYCAKAVLLAAAVLFPALAHAQSLAGTVRDASGGVLPGVTVEAASPVLIEKVRTATTDNTGQYRIENLPPGTYVVTFSLQGFTTVKRPDIAVSGSGVVTISADLQVGGIQDLITVTGESPVVDTQTSTRRQMVLSNDTIQAIPASRGYGNLLATVPGIQATGLDVSSGVSTNFFTARGGRGNEGTIQIDGMNVGSAFNGGGVAGFGYPIGESSEIQVTISGGLGETDRGGPAFNLIPKTGGNEFRGTGFLSTAGKWSQGDNLNDELRSFGLTNVPALIKNWDTNFALGGPIIKDRLWFFNNVRSYGNHQEIPGLFGNRNAGNQASWIYERDESLPARADAAKMIEAIRLTGQPTVRHKVGFYLDYQKVCNGSAFARGAEQCRDRGEDWIALGSVGAGFFGALAPEAGNVWDDREKITQFSWTSPFTNKLLLEAGFSQFASRFGGSIPGGALTDFIPVQEQVSSPTTGTPVGNFTYRGWASAGSNEQFHNVWRASASYVTGAHSMKVGYQAAFQVQKNFQNVGSPLSYIFNNRNPIQFTLRDAPFWSSNRTRFDAFYVQDQYTRGRLTLQGGLRYEHAWSWFPEGENGVVADNAYGTRFLFPENKGVTGYHDITPRMGAAYDVFGNGRTSLKVNISKYLQAANNDAQYTIANPATTFQQTTNVSWTDSNGNKVVDCNVMNRLGENNTATGGDVCGAWQNLNFGNPFSTTTVNPDVLHGWGVRPYDWQFSVGVQHEVFTRVAVDVQYSRRWWGNHFFTDNRALTPADFDTATITAPSNPGLPNGGGYPVTFVTRNARSPIGATDNYYTFADDFGDVTTYWHGVDFTVNARTRNGITFQGGTSTGRGVRDYCNITNALPELFVTVGSVLANAQSAACAVTEPWLTTYRSSVSYTLPKIDVLLAGSVRSTPNVQPSTINTFVATNGASLAANYNVNSTILQTQSNLARPLTPGLAFQTVDLTLPGDVYPDRVNSVDLRVAKVLRFGRTSTNVGFDFYNLLNANTGTAFQQVFNPDPAAVNTWGRPTSILNPRFARFNVTVNF
ncbi:MAG TPA: carboxypeptidase regulatory-like domain-containing protein [Vicinamibacterales bacterium]